MSKRLIMLAALASLSLPGTARADAIDGHWCHDEEGRLSISGPHIVTPGGVRMQGTYGRHSFSYVAPTADRRAGETIQMILIDDDTVHVAVDASGATPPQVWHRCRAPIS